MKGNNTANEPKKYGELQIQNAKNPTTKTAISQKSLNTLILIFFYSYYNQGCLD